MPQRDACIELDALDAAVVVEADIVVDAEIVPLAGQDHVVVAVEPQLHRPPGLLRQQRRDDGDQRGLRFLAAERRRPCAASRRSRHGRTVSARARPDAAPRSDAGWSCGPACRRPRRARPWRPGLRGRNAPGRRHRCGPAAGAARAPAPPSASPRCMIWVGSTKVCAASASSMVRIGFSTSYSMTAFAAAAARQRDAVGGDREDRLAVIFDQPVGEDRIAGKRRPDIVDARDVLGRHAPRRRPATRRRRRRPVDVIRACACGLRHDSACSSPGGSGMSSI